MHAYVCALCVCVGGWVVCEAEDNLQNSVFSFHHMGPGD